MQCYLLRLHGQNHRIQAVNLHVHSWGTPIQFESSASSASFVKKPMLGSFPASSKASRNPALQDTLCTKYFVTRTLPSRNKASNSVSFLPHPLKLTTTPRVCHEVSACASPQRLATDLFGQLYPVLVCHALGSDPRKRSQVIPPSLHLPNHFV